MCITAYRFYKLLKQTHYSTLKRPLRGRIYPTISRFTPIFFIISYFVIAIELWFNDVGSVFYCMVTVVFICGGFIILLIENQIIIIKALRKKNREFQNVLNQTSDSNDQLKNEINRQVAAITWQDRLLSTVNEIASILLASSVEGFETIMRHCMGMLGETMDVDRVYVWKNYLKNGQFYCTQVYEWSENVELQQSNELTVNISYDNVLGWEEKLSIGKSINGPVYTLSQHEQDHLNPQGVLSLLVLPVFLQDVFWGFVGFDDCQKQRWFSDVEEGILLSASLLIAHAMLRNETTQKLLQAREEAVSSTKAKSDFLASMSHEIRTPINAITGMSAIARKTDDIKKAHSCLDKIDTASRQLLALINDILDMSKIEAQKLELAHEPFELKTLIYNINSIIGVCMTEKKQTLVIDMASNVPEIVVGDDMRLTQVLLNLLANAVKFTPEGGRIDLSLKLIGQANGRYEMEAVVKDNGIGIKAEQLERLFSAFEQADRGTARRFGGTGLGLTISKSIIDLMDGTITVTSEPNQGSSFTVRFFIDAGTKDMLKQKQIKKNEINYDFTGYTALLVEDIAINREIVLEILRDTNITMDCAENGQEALEIFATAPDRYDIIFMDVHMPIMDGYTATEALRALDLPMSDTVPIIAMTANAFSDDVERSKEVGMNDHIAKPIDVDILLQKIAKYLP